VIVRSLAIAATLLAGSAMASTASAAEGWATASVNMRTCASTRCARILTIPAGARVEVLRSGSWYEVIYAGRRGWASGSYIALGGQPAPTYQYSYPGYYYDYPSVYWYFGSPGYYFWFDDRGHRHHGHKPPHGRHHYGPKPPSGGGDNNGPPPHRPHVPFPGNSTGPSSGGGQQGGMNHPRFPRNGSGGPPAIGSGGVTGPSGGGSGGRPFIRSPGRLGGGGLGGGGGGGNCPPGSPFCR
jgi:uncharacterized protein YraI